MPDPENTEAPVYTTVIAAKLTKIGTSSRDRH
jgi:hypothetical protein